MYRENPGFPWLVVVPILFALFSAFLVKPIQAPSRSSPSEKRESSRAALASNIQIQPGQSATPAQNATPSSLGSPVATPTGQPRPAPERNPGLVIGGGMIALIIILGLLRFSSHPKPTGP